MTARIIRKSLPGIPTSETPGNRAGSATGDLLGTCSWQELSGRSPSAIFPRRPLRRDVAICNILRDRGGIALFRRAVAAGAGKAEAQHVAALDGAGFLRLQRLGIAVRIEDALRLGARPAAEDAVGRKHVAVAEMGEHRGRIQKLDVLADAAAPAPL